MPDVIAAACIDFTDKSCLEECPVDCIYESARKLYQGDRKLYEVS